MLDLKTSMFVADWTLDVCSSSFHKPKPAAPYAQIKKTKLLPYFNHTQAKLLLRLINHMQQQVLTQVPISVPYTLLNNTPTSHDLIAKLPTLRYFEDNKSFQLFSSEEWQKNELQLSLSALGGELLLGLYEPYSDWLRGNYLQHPRLEPVMLHAPLHLWQPLWLDARGDEQMFYLYLEAIAQEHDLDATMLAHGISHSKCLHGLGRKLVEHGHLATPPQTLASNIDWLPNRITERQNLREEYLRNVCRCYAKTLLPAVVKNIIAKLAQPNLSAQSLCQELVSICADADEHVNQVSMISPAAPIIDLALFFDWTLRKHLPNLPLPESLAGSELQRIVNTNTPLMQRYVDFSAYLQQHKQLAVEMLAVPSTCLVNMDVPTTTSSASSSLSSASSLSSSSSSVSSRADTEVASLDATEVGSVALLPTQSRIKKIAGIELSKLKTRSRKEYLQLEQQYINSLDAEAKESVLGIKKYMQASVFENQLRPRIISFMIENPSVWNRTEAIKALQVFDRN